MRVCVCIPTYNEAENINTILRRARAALPAAQLLVLDDASPDGTGTLADQFASNDAGVAVVHRPAKEGLGAAYLDGFRWALERDFDVVVEMDADGSHAPEELPRLLIALRAGFRVVEVPITFVEREYGASKMDRRIIAEALWRVTGWALTSRLRLRGARQAGGGG